MSGPKSRRIPHPIWFAVVGMLMVALWIVLEVWLPYHREQVAIREIERLGGGVAEMWEGPIGVKDRPEWMQELLDDGWLPWFDRVCAVDLDDSRVDDDLFQHLSGLTYLQSLSCERTQFSNKGLKYLSGLNKLEWLFLRNTRVTDEGLIHLSSMTNLGSLTLNTRQITDEGLNHLSGLKNLWKLSLENTQVTDEGLRHLIGLTSLEYLYLDNTQVTEEGVKELRKSLPDCEISY